MTYMMLLNCALKLVEEIILYYDTRSKKHTKKSRLEIVTFLTMQFLQTFVTYIVTLISMYCRSGN